MFTDKGFSEAEKDYADDSFIGKCIKPRDC